MSFGRFALIPATLFALSSAVAVALGRPDAAAKVDFAREVQPLLKAHCFQCHGPDKALGGLRLDARALAMKGGASGVPIVAGSSAKSLLVTRILGGDGRPRMPLGFAPLTDKQIALVRAWVDQGAKWDEAPVKPHWAYIAPKLSPVPQIRNPQSAIRNPIDAFVLARLRKEGLKPSPEADRVTLIRRVTLDLTGLPPTPREVDAFLADRSPNAYEKVVDRLLANPHYGERMALPWLDAARYADSNGFQQDGDTYQYVWRDWVVKAFNEDMPFDKFTIEQLAGDLLPNATLEDRIATGFNRCHLLNGEGGAIPEEQRNVILFDRVDVTATTWLGATMACCQCHNHKYDPYTMRDYYSMMAFFNNVPESGVPPGGGQYRIADPSVPAPSESDSVKIGDIESRIAAAKADAQRIADGPKIDAAEGAWEAGVLKSQGAPVAPGEWSAVGPFPADSFDSGYDTVFEPEKLVDLSKVYLDGKLKWAPRPALKDGAVFPLEEGVYAYYFTRMIHADGPRQLALSLGSDDAIKVWVNGKLALTSKSLRAAAPDQEKVTVGLQQGDNRLLVKIVNGGGIGGFYFKALESSVPSNVESILRKDRAARTGAESKQVRDYFLSTQPPAPLVSARERTTALQKELESFRASIPRVMVMSDDRPRKTHVLQRGNYEMPEEEVTCNTPVFLPPMPPDAPRNRLGLAKWLVSAENPLTARVQVNRYWQLFFGQGLVRTSENLGTQCDPPTHPELLDWLAVTFRDDLHWSIKKLCRLIVTSSTYRQSSRVTQELRQRDPENRLLARGPRFRLPSLLLRDVALASSGLLNPAMGGKPVYPYQPKGIWDGLAITNERDFTYPQSKGPDLYRRSLYTFWRRTVAPSDMFDTSTRQTCKVRLTITSTPLQALTMLNDVVWVEAGRTLAEHVMKEAGNDPDARLTEAFRRVCSRRPSSDELRVLRRSLDRALATYRADPKAAEAYLKQGDSPRDASLDPVEHAAYATVCLAIYNLDEALTKE
jgi:mono/diheme cytochrome c family protein